MYTRLYIRTDEDIYREINTYICIYIYILYIYIYIYIYMYMVQMIADIPRVNWSLLVGSSNVCRPLLTRVWHLTSVPMISTMPHSATHSATHCNTLFGQECGT